MLELTATDSHGADAVNVILSADDHRRVWRMLLGRDLKPNQEIALEAHVLLSKLARLPIPHQPTPEQRDRLANGA